MNRIQRKKITFEILTRAEEPLELDNTEKSALIAALEQAVRKNVNLDYHPEGNRYLDARHELLGVDIVEVF